MLRSILFSSLILCVFTIIGCNKPNEEKAERKRERLSKDQFFAVQQTIKLSELKNEMDQGETDLLRSFAEDDFPWQHWNKEILEKSQGSQKTIFALLTNPLNKSSRDIGKLFASTPEFKKLLQDHYVCTVIDTHATPEIGMLAFYLSGEIAQPVTFPMAVWFTHEGNPIAWIPFGEMEQKRVKKILNNSHVMIQDMWDNQQHYAVTNSRADQEQRQKRLDRNLMKPKPKGTKAKPLAELDRQEVFLEGARKVSSFYDKHSLDIDGIGGLLPSSVMQVLALQISHPTTYQGTRKNSEEALRGIFHSISHGAVHDGVEGDYFYARRNYGWSLPSFSRDLTSQALLAKSLFISAGILKDPEFLKGAENLLRRLEDHWLGKNKRFAISAGSRQDATNVFLFEYDVLRELLGEDDFPIAREHFKIRRQGNIDSANDYTRRYLNLNTLGPQKPISEVAETLNLNKNEVQQALKRIRTKIAARRQETGQLITESTIDSGTLALIGRAQIARYRTNPSKENLTKCLKTGRDLLKIYTTEGKDLKRLKLNIKARGIDYARCSQLLLELYLVTFDSHWLSSCQTLVDEAIRLLQRDGFPLMETLPSERIIPLKTHNSSMIFSDSSLGALDETLGTLHVLTGKESYQKERDLIWKALQYATLRTPITHTDLLISISYGDHPIQAVIQGDQKSKAYQNLLHAIQNPAISSHLITRPANGEGLTQLPNLESITEPVQISLFQKNTLLGRANTLKKVEKILENALSKKE